MTQKEFSELVYRYEEIEDKESAEAQELADMIDDARNCDEPGIFLQQCPNGNIACLRISVYDDDDSPDGISFNYDEFEIDPDNNIVESDGGCYWGFLSIRDMMEDMLGVEEWTEVFDDDIDTMIFETEFDYKKLAEVLKGVTENG